MEIADALAPWDGTTSRRDFLRTSGLFVLGFSGAGLVGFGPRAPGGGPPEANPYPDPDFLQLDAWLVVHEDGTATFYVGKTDGGQGTGTAMRQMMCDELDIAYADATLVMGRTDMTVDQGGSGGSDAIERDALPARRVAAEARRVLLELASEHFERPVEDLAVNEGVISVGADPSRAVTYGELVGGRRFDVALTGRNVNETTGLASVKPVQELKIVGQPIPRYDIPAKVDGSLEWAVDVKLPGMVHARNVRPPLAGARLIAVDESSVRDLPGFLRVVREGNYLAVVCEREEQAIDAAERLETEWEKPETRPFPSSEDLFDYMRDAPPVNAGGSGRTPRARVEGDPDAALAGAATVVKAAYDIPFQGHTAIGPAHAVADPSDGQMTVYTNDMKPYSHRTGIAEFLGMPPERVRVIWMDGPQLYGRTAADDAGFEAAYLARELGRPGARPVDETRGDGLGHEGPGLRRRPPRRSRRRGQASSPWTTAPGSRTTRTSGTTRPTPCSSRSSWGSGPSGRPPGAAAAPTRCTTSRTGARRPARSASRSPSRRRSAPATCGTPTGRRRPSPASRSSTNWPPPPTRTLSSSVSGSSAGRARTTTPSCARVRSPSSRRPPRRTAGIPDPHPSHPRRGRRTPGGSSRGAALPTPTAPERWSATIAEVEVDRESGRVWVRRMVCAHDCGLVINPDGLESTVQGNLLHGISRTLYEEVRFDGEKVTSVDWRTHPTLAHTDAPERIDVVIVNGDPNPDRPDLPHYGAGEPSHRTVAAAVANAIHDATGVRLRRIPLRPERVLAALTAAGV